MSKNKNRIDVFNSKIQLESMDFEVIVMNSYQFRVYLPNWSNDFYDWYHTSGVVVVNREERDFAAMKTGVKCLTAKELADFIFKKEGMNLL